MEMWRCVVVTPIDSGKAKFSFLMVQLVAFWELVTNGTVPEGMRLHPAKVAG